MSELNELQLFGMKVIEIRKQRGWSQEKLALECGLARSYMSGIERGKRNLALLNIYKLARTLDVPISAFFEPLDTKAKE